MTGEDFEFNPTDPACDSLWPPEFDIAQVNAFVAVQKTHDWFKDLQPAAIAIDENLQCVVNTVFPSCNATFHPTVGILVSRGFGACNNLAIRSVVSHEYGHFIINQVGFSDLTVDFMAFSEGASDTVATLLWNHSEYGMDRSKDNQPWRDIETDVPLDSCGPEGFCTPVNCGIHCRGQALGGAFWDLRKKLMFCTGSETACPPDCPGSDVCVDGICLTECTSNVNCDPSPKTSVQRWAFS